MITSERAKLTCSHWHGGQWSALYQFASSELYAVENHLRYLQEIETCLHPEYNLYPGQLSQKDELALNRLKRYFIETGKRNGVTTIYREHPIYGYQIPYLGKETANELTEQVKALYYPV